jgi:hypothetical protein
MVRTSSCTVRTIEVPRITEVRVPPELWMKIHPVIRVLCLVECEAEYFQSSFDFIENPAADDFNCLVELVLPGFVFGHSLSPHSP